MGLPKKLKPFIDLDKLSPLTAMELLAVAGRALWTIEYSDGVVDVIDFEDAYDNASFSFEYDDYHWIPDNRFEDLLCLDLDKSDWAALVLALTNKFLGGV